MGTNISIQDKSNIFFNWPKDIPRLMLTSNSDGTYNGEYIDEANPDKSFKFENAIIMETNVKSYGPETSPLKI